MNFKYFVMNFFFKFEILIVCRMVNLIINVSFFYCLFGVNLLVKGKIFFDVVLIYGLVIFINIVSFFGLFYLLLNWKCEVDFISRWILFRVFD